MAAARAVGDAVYGFGSGGCMRCVVGCVGGGRIVLVSRVSW